MNFHMLINAFINAGLPEKDAWDAAFLYRNVNLILSGDGQADYNEAVREEINSWES